MSGKTFSPARKLVASDQITASLNVPVADVLNPSEVAQHFADQLKPVDAIPTPLASWNRQCRDDGGGVGLAMGWHVLLASTTGAGKSLLGLNVGAEAIRQGVRVGFISLEMSVHQLSSRLYAILTGTEVRRLERGETFSPEAADAAAKKVAEIREAGGGFHVNRRPMYDISDVLGLMAYFHEMHDCALYVVDYLQICGAKDAESLFQQVSNVSGHIREFAQTHNVVTVGLSQLNRRTSSEHGTRPIVQGLMASSSLENDADQVILLDHSRYQSDPATRTARTYALLAKNRHGSQGEIPICWEYDTLRVREARPDEEDEWP